MPKKRVHHPDWHSTVYLAMSALYLLGCLGLNETAAGVGLAICYYLLYRG